jgi:hypothetical protein
MENQNIKSDQAMDSPDCDLHTEPTGGRRKKSVLCFILWMASVLVYTIVLMVFDIKADHAFKPLDILMKMARVSYTDDFNTTDYE